MQQIIFERKYYIETNDDATQKCSFYSRLPTFQALGMYGSYPKKISNSIAKQQLLASLNRSIILSGLICVIYPPFRSERFSGITFCSRSTLEGLVLASCTSFGVVSHSPFRGRLHTAMDEKTQAQFLYLAEYYEGISLRNIIAQNISKYLHT